MLCCALADPPGPAAKHKGFGLAAVVEMLCAVLTGQKVGRENLGDDPTRRDDSEANWAQWFLVMQTDAVTSEDEFKGNLGRMTELMRSEPKAAGATEAPMLPGDPEEMTAIERSSGGIPLTPADVAALASVAELCGLTVPPTTDEPMAARPRL